MSERKRKTHILKIWPMFFAEIIEGRKRWEFRATRDLDFGLIDILDLREWDPCEARYTGRRARCQVLSMVASSSGYAALRIDLLSVNHSKREEGG